MNWLRRLFFNLFVWIASISIVTCSVVFVLPNAQLHKKRLVENGFYDKINTQLKPQTDKDKSLVKNGFSYILSNTIISEIVTPTWLRGVVENNIDITSDWLNGGEKWELYVPTRDIEQSIQKGVDTQTQSFVDTNKKEIKVCTLPQAEAIKQQGFDLSKEFCIPSEVRNGQKTMTEYISDSALTPSTGILNKLVKGSNLNDTSEIQNIGELTQTFSENKKKVISTVITVRDQFVTLRSNILSVLLILLGLLLANIWLVYMTRRKILYFIFRSSFFISLLTVIFSGGVVLFIGGASYLSSILKDFLLPGFVTNEVVKIVTEQLVIFAIDLVFPALIIALAFFVVGTISWLLNRFDVFVPQKYKQFQAPKDTTYNTFFGSPEDQILAENTHEKKLELLKTYKPNVENEVSGTPTLPAPLLRLPGTFKRRFKKKEKVESKEPIVLPIQPSTQTIHPQETTKTPRKIQL